MRDKAELINKIIDYKQFKAYLELGVGTALETITQIQCNHIESVDIIRCNENFPSFIGTTDGFFAKNTKKFDVIYIDADHSHESVNRDFVNAVNALSDDGVIFMHDVGPVNEENTLPTASGTAYKSFIEIRANANFDAFTYEFENGDVIGIVKKRINTNVLKIYELDWNFYNNNRNNILQKKSVEEILKLV